MKKSIHMAENSWGDTNALCKLLLQTADAQRPMYTRAMYRHFESQAHPSTQSSLPRHRLAAMSKAAPAPALPPNGLAPKPTCTPSSLAPTGAMPRGDGLTPRCLKIGTRV
jgi:hypothetical protein